MLLRPRGSATISIGGVNLRVRSQSTVELLEEFPDYAGFRSSCLPPGDTLRVPVRLRWDSPPVCPDRSPDFRNSSGRAIWCSASDIRIREKPKGFHEALWVCRIRPSVPDVTVECGPDLLDRHARVPRLHNPVSYPLDYLVMSHVLALQHGLIVHAAGIVWRGEGILFPGRSGTGKSTWVRNVHARGVGAAMSDDRIVVRRLRGGRVVMAGTPWLGDAGVCVNHAASLRRLVFIRQAVNNRVRRLSASECLARLLPALSLPWYDPRSIRGASAFCERLVERFPAWELACTRTVDPGVWLERMAAADS